MTNKTLEIKNKLDKKHNGTFFKVTIRSKLPTVAKSPDLIEKVVVMTVRKGIKYGNQKSVKEKGIIPGSLPWGRWIDGFEGLFIEHNGNEYVRLYCSPNKSKTTYYCNGREVDRSEIEWEVRPSYWKHSDKPDAMTIRTENLEVL